MIVMGLDGGLQAFGLAQTEGPGITPRRWCLRPKTTGHVRLEYLRREVAAIA